MSPADADRQYQMKRGRKPDIDAKVYALVGRIEALNSGIASGNVGIKISNFVERIFKSIDLHFTNISENSLDRNITQLKGSLPERTAIGKQDNNTHDLSTIRQNIIDNADAYDNITLPQLKKLVKEQLESSEGGYSEKNVESLLGSLLHPDLGSDDYIVIDTSEISYIPPDDNNTHDLSTIRQNIIDNANAYDNITLPQLKKLVKEQLESSEGGYSEKNVEFLLGSLSHPDLGSDDYIAVDTSEIPDIPPDDIQVMRDFKYYMLQKIKTSPTMTQNQIETEINNFVNGSNDVDPARAEKIKATLKTVVSPEQGLNLQERLILIDALWDRWLQSEFI